LVRHRIESRQRRDGSEIVTETAIREKVSTAARPFLIPCALLCRVDRGPPSVSPFHSVGEGIETVLSPLTAMPGTTGAAALSVGSLGSFAPPPGLARLVIALDNDAEGERAAERPARCCERAAERPARCCERAGVATLVVVPEGGDFNDDLVALGPCALRARLHTLLCVRDAAAGRA